MKYPNTYFFKVCNIWKKLMTVISASKRELHYGWEPILPGGLWSLKSQVWCTGKKVGLRQIMDISCSCVCLHPSPTPLQGWTSIAVWLISQLLSLPPIYSFTGVSLQEVPWMSTWVLASASQTTWTHVWVNRYGGNNEKKPEGMPHSRSERGKGALSRGKSIWKCHPSSLLKKVGKNIKDIGSSKTKQNLWSIRAVWIFFSSPKCHDKSFKAKNFLWFMFQQDHHTEGKNEPFLKVEFSDDTILTSVTIYIQNAQFFYVPSMYISANFKVPTNSFQLNTVARIHSYFKRCYEENVLIIWAASWWFCSNLILTLN